MHKIYLIIAREYVSRVQKKSFWIASILAPFLLTAIYAIPIFLALQDKEVKNVQIIDQSGLFRPTDLKHKEVVFTLGKGDPGQLKKQFAAKGFVALVLVPKDILVNPHGLKMYATKSIALPVKEAIEEVVQDRVRAELMQKAGISATVYEETQASISGDTITVSAQGDETNSSAAGAMILAGVMGLILYITLLLYGSQVMNGVIEEKSSRIIEVIISSVKPYQLLLGKIIGVGFVGLTQFALWICLTLGLSQLTKLFLQMPSNIPAARVDNLPMQEVTKVLESTNIPLILTSFLFFFFVGYLLYSSLFAAIGSAVESPSEAQQFTFIVMVPIIISFLMAQQTMQDPDSEVAFWASMIPFTSPINMMVRLPYGVPTWQLITSMSLLVLGFLGCTWISARIYRVGILMYGKKVTWKELWKWLFY